MTVVDIPCEIKTDEYRVAMLPVGVEELTLRGHRVVVHYCVANMPGPSVGPAHTPYATSRSRTF